jgi:hypothetical protein
MSKRALWDKDDEQLWSWAQAGLGFLLPLNDWTWWHHPDVIETLLFGVTKSRKNIIWGGGKQLKNPQEWLDRRRAIVIARAATELEQALTPLRLRLSKELWSWAAPDEMVALRDNLIRVFPYSVQVFDWPVSRKPRREYFHRSEEDRLVVSSEAETRELAVAMVSGLQEAEFSEETRSADIVIGSAQYAQSFSYVDLVIIVEAYSATALAAMDKLRIRGARCIMHVNGDVKKLALWLEGFARNWLYQPTYQALYHSVEIEDATIDILAANSTFLDRRVDNLMQLRSQQRSIGRTIPKGSPARVNELSDLVSVKQPAIESSESRTTIPSARVLNASVHSGGKIVKNFPRTGEISIQVSIRYRSVFDDGRANFPSHRVDWSESVKILKVHMVSVERKIISAELELPKLGNSSLATFQYLVSREPIDIRFIVADGTRIIQTSRLKGMPGEAIEFTIESASDNLERDSSTFDFSLLVNNSLGHRPSATALTPEGITITMLDAQDIANARKTLVEEIEKLVKFPSMQPDATFYRLAGTGKLLLDGLKRYIPTWPQDLKRVQLTTQSNAYFPLEFLYDGKIPRNDDAPLCPERASCLNDGVARQSCSIRSANKHLCPMGFLGVSAIIERQTWSLGMTTLPWLSPPRDFESRRKITSLAKTAFAASHHADAFTEAELAAGLPIVRLAEIAGELGTMIEDWDTWEDAVRENPKLLTLITHVSGDHLFIGENDAMSFAAIDKEHIGSGHPIVIAMGCSSALSSITFTSLPAALMNNGAAVVIAALTEILGRHTNIMTLQIVKQLKSAAKAKTESTIAEIISAVRRAMLVDDLAIGLVVVAFGDGDFKLGKKIRRDDSV